MNNAFTTRLNRAQKVADFINGHITDLTATPNVNTNLLPVLQIFITRAGTGGMHDITDNPGFANRKKAVRVKMQENVFHISTALVSYADDSNDFALMNMYDFTYAAIEDFSDSRLLSFAKDVRQMASDGTVAELKKNYNVTDGDMQALTDDIASFSEIIYLQGGQINEMSDYGNHILQGAETMDDTIERIRRQMDTYRKSNRPLFDAFTDACMIKDAG